MKLKSLQSNTKYQMKKIKKIILVAGEESGDMYAKNIINNLSKHNHIKFYGMGSTHMHDTKAEIIVNSSELSVIGFIEIFKIYPKLKSALNKMKNSLQQSNQIYWY